MIIPPQKKRTKKGKQQKQPYTFTEPLDCRFVWPNYGALYTFSKKLSCVNRAPAQHHLRDPPPGLVASVKQIGKERKKGLSVLSVLAFRSRNIKKSQTNNTKSIGLARNVKECCNVQHNAGKRGHRRWNQDIREAPRSPRSHPISRRRLRFVRGIILPKAGLPSIHLKHQISASKF